ncbi:MAG: hypothetical protein FWD38_12015, partial [Oscillospiraceae bacterium]|nr:hypothetical protein [Oscillospiraceae bacterium]
MRLYDFVMPIIALVIVIVLFISIRLAGRATKVLEQDKESRPDLIPFLKYRHNWLQISVCLQAIELICIILAFAATAMTIFVVTRIPVDGE